MVRYYCDWCDAPITDDHTLSSHEIMLPVEEMPGIKCDVDGRPIMHRINIGKEPRSYLICDNCFDRIMRLKYSIRDRDNLF